MDGGGGGGSTKGASVFLPPNQGGAAAGFNSLIQPMQNQALNQLQQLDTLGTPAGLAYPQVKDSAFNIVNNPNQNTALSGAQNAMDIFNQQYAPFVNQAVPGITNMSNMAQGGAANLMGDTGALMGAVNNPAYGQAGQLGSQLAPTYAGAIPGVMGAAGSIMNTAFDPQSSLYNRTAQQTQDQLGAFSGGRGTSGSPYSAGIASDALNNFNIDWQNNQLNRQVTGAQGASGLLNTAEGLGKSAQTSLLTPANANLAAQSTGVQGLGTIGSGINQAGAATDNAATTGAGLLNNLASGTASYGALPYNTYNTVQNADLGAMQNLISLGNSMYQPGQQVASDQLQYMGLGQSASQLANTIGNTNFNQQMAGAQGIGSLGLGATNTLFGTGGGGGGSGLLSGLFGGGGGGGTFAGNASAFADTAAATSPFAADSVDFGTSLAQAAPLAAISA